MKSGIAIDNVKPATVHMLAWRHSVVARLDRATQYSETAAIEPKSRGVLDAPVKPGHDSGECGCSAESVIAANATTYAFFLTSLTLVNSMPSARSLV
ncbi:hypothetical protein GCM10010987_41620 [Bradyrhizobium guangdongense]|uniref:Uncharacterized protein n=1 Tax=Bradyrhizobium guangdongense TaxID=1325090 RepID=A0AA87W6W9_9BRAD|nr:hypothetical protein GCM10010987_41620 [Bradyrhizobium guangdongense]